MMPACRWINAIHGSTDGKGSGEVQVGDATPRSGRLSKLMQSDLEDSSAPRTEIVTVDTLTNKVNGLWCWSCLVLVLVLVLHPPPDTLSRLYTLPCLIIFLPAFSCPFAERPRCEGSWRPQRQSSHVLRPRPRVASQHRAFRSVSS